MVRFQKWLVSAFASVGPVRDLMHTAWAWPAAESIHFIGLSLLVGTIFLFDLRLLGVGRQIPIRRLHRLVPWGLGGYGCTVGTGLLFLLAEPDQYIYNPAFHFKLLFMAAAGVNALLFYLTTYDDVTAAGAAANPPGRAKVIAAASVLLWLSVIVAGRLLTFYRPSPCGPEGPGTLAECIPDYYR
jgi:hypothetical protein